MTAVANGDIDMVAFGGLFIGNPDLVERLRRDAPVVVAPREVFYGGGAKRYPDFSALEAEEVRTERAL
jgi:N-ethylmaleimide reductase